MPSDAVPDHGAARARTCQEVRPPMSTPSLHDDPGRWLPRADAARALGVSLRTLDRHVANHRYPARRRAQGAVEVWVPEAVDSPLASHVASVPAAGPTLAEWDAMSLALTRQLTPLLDTLARQQADLTCQMATLATLEAENMALRARLARHESPSWWRRLLARVAARQGGG
jgi:hypothetical protein